MVSSAASSGRATRCASATPPRRTRRAADELELTATGPGGSSTVAIAIHVVPLAQNSPPQCSPVTEARRSDGLAPVEVWLWQSCTDAEHDGLTLHGGGPGVHLDAPGHVAGGRGSSGST